MSHVQRIVLKILEHVSLIIPTEEIDSDLLEMSFCVVDCLKGALIWEHQLVFSLLAVLQFRG